MPAAEARASFRVVERFRTYLSRAGRASGSGEGPMNELSGSSMMQRTHLQDNCRGPESVGEAVAWSRPRGARELQALVLACRADKFEGCHPKDA